MSDAETIKVYGAKAGDYADLTPSDYQIRAMAAFTEGLATGAHIFDLGCGPGLHSADFMAQGFEVSALDATPEFVAAAKGRGVNARLGTFDDVTEVAAYDGVWASFSLLHAARADFPRNLASAVASLRAGGRMFLGMKIGTGEERDGLGRMYGYYTAQELRDHFLALGMRVVWEEEGAEKGLAGSVDPFVLMVVKHV